MQNLNDNHGLPTVHQALRYAVIRLQSDPETAPIATELTAVRTQLTKAEELHDDVFERWMSATAVVRYLDAKLGTIVSRISRDAFNMVEGNRKAPRYQKIFATPPSEGMRGIATDPQERYVRTIVDTIEKHDDLASLRTHVPATVAALGELKTAVGVRDETRLQEGIAQRDLRMRLDEAKRAYNLLYPRLQLLFPDDRAYVETFFRRLNTRGVVIDADEPVEPVAPVEPVVPTA
jgi:hypothetical protein